MGRKQIEELLNEGRVALGNALATPEILALLTALGYGQAKLQEGEALRQALEDKHAAQLRLYARQKESTAALRAEWGAARKLYGRHIKIARALLTDRPELLARLGLEGSRLEAIGPWLEQARQFYREALADPSLAELLVAGGLDRSVLEQGQAALDAVAEANRHQESAKGLAQQSTQDRNAAAVEFKQWMRNFWKIAEVALSDQPQWLERLGRRARS